MTSTTRPEDPPPGEGKTIPAAGTRAPEYPAPVEAARERHAAAIGVEVGLVTVVSYEATNWNDSSLGCGRPGEMYLQVITPGYRVVVSYDSEKAVYHTDLRDPPAILRCDRPVTGNVGDAPAPGSPTE